ncbi:hypothetical protein D3C80_1818370 [compost metagenome]
MLIFFAFRKAIISSVVPVAMLLVNKQPTLERTIFGLYKSLFGLAIITASKFAASAVLKIAPIFPGFSGASATRISGLSPKFNSDRERFLDFAMARIPSVVSR